jgi:hypothetical protein
MRHLLVRRSQSGSIYWVAAIAPGPLPSYVTGLAPASPGHFPTDVQWNGPNRALLWRSNSVCVCVFVWSSKHSSMLPPLK